MLIFFYPWTQYILPLICNFFIYFFSVLLISEYRFFMSFVKFTPSYYILLEAIVNGIVFLVSLPDSSLLVYKNATNFWTFILCPLIYWIHLSILGVYWRNICTSPNVVMFSANDDRFSSSFPFWKLLIHLLVWMLWLSKSGKSRHSCLVPDIKGKHFFSYRVWC